MCSPAPAPLPTPTLIATPASARSPTHRSTVATPLRAPRSPPSRAVRTTASSTSVCRAQRLSEILLLSSSSSAAAAQSSQAAECSSISREAPPLATSSSESRNRLHSSSFFRRKSNIVPPAFRQLLLLHPANRFPNRYCPRSSLTKLKIRRSLCPFPRFHHNSSPCAKQSDLHRIRIQVQNLCNLFDRKPFHFLQDQHHLVPLVQALQQPIHLLPRFELVADVQRRRRSFLRRSNLPLACTSLKSDS